MAGWIKLYRNIQEHWIWQDANKLKWWLDIILMANHKDKKFLLGNEIFEVKRGCFHTSELKLAERWCVSKNTVRRFLELLEKDKMVNLKKTRKGTTIEVSNYNDYQEIFREEKTINEPQHEPQSDHEVNHIGTISEPYGDHEVNTNKNDKNDKECKEGKNDKKKEECGEVFLKYENEIGLLSPVVADTIHSYLEDGFESALIIKAIEIAVDKNKRNIAYVKGILNNLGSRNVKTLSSYEAESRDNNETNNRGTEKIEYSPAELLQQQYKPRPEDYDENIPF